MRNCRARHSSGRGETDKTDAISKESPLKGAFVTFHGPKIEDYQTLDGNTFEWEIIFYFSFNIGWIQAAFNFKIGSNREQGLATFQVLKIKLSFNLIEKRFRGELKLLHWQNIKPLDIFDEALLWKVINLKCWSPFPKWRSLTCLLLFPSDFSSDEKTLILGRKRTPLIKKVSHYFKPKSF